MMIEQTNKYSFYELISQKDMVIEIPKVQRDYVQGRENEHAKGVLERLLKDIRKALESDKEPLELQFVYGKEDNGRFIPIDGQQRLTTLFLIHIYAFREDASKDEILKRFSYDTRHTSKEFIEKLVENRAEIFREMDKLEDGNIRDIIVDLAWFNSLAIYDPTVTAMINALNVIYKEFKGCENLGQKLMDCENKKVIFNFLNMDSLGMEDSLYIKLNARGKQLTKFENFKASLFKILDNIEEYSLVEKNEFISKFDNSWTDIFWQCAKGISKNNFFDVLFERFFKILLVNRKILNVQDDILDIDNFEVNDKVNKEFFDTLKYLLDYLSDNKNKNTNEYTEIYNGTINILKDNYTYEDMVFSHMITSFISKAKGEVTNNLVAYKRWTRIFKNLIYNTTIDIDEKRNRAVESINSMLDGWNNLYQCFQNPQSKINFFETNQVEEEKVKVNIILEEEANQKTEFSEEIYKAEEHKYFKGQIRGALYRAYNFESKKYDLEKFRKYWNVINGLFDETKPKDGVKLCRTLLCYGDYRMSVSTYKTLCVDIVNDSVGTPSMKNLFSKRKLMEQTQSDKIVSLLLDDLANRVSVVGKEADINKVLESIIQDKKDDIHQNDWRWCFVNYKGNRDVFGVMGRRRMRNDYGEELLIRNTSSSGLNPNIFLMVIGLEIGCDATDLYYYPNRGVASEHPLYFLKTEDNGWLYLMQEQDSENILCMKSGASSNNSEKVMCFSGEKMIEDVVDFCKRCKNKEI